MKRKFSIIQIAIAAVSLVLCTSSGAEEVEKVAESRNETIKIAVIYAQTGEAVLSNTNHFKMMQFAVKEVNAAGGVLGKKIELLEFNNNSTAIGSKIAAKKVIQSGAVAVIGPLWSSHALGAAPIFQEAKVPVILPISTNPKTTLVGDYIFRACFIDTLQGKAMANYAINELKAKKAVVLTNTGNKYSVDLAKFFIKNFEKLGGEILWEGDYLSSEVDYKHVLQKTNSLKPDAIYLPGYSKDSAKIIKQARKMGIKTTFLGGDGWSLNMYKFSGHHIDGSLLTAHWHRDDPRKISREFLKRYEKEYGEMKYTPLSYDAVKLLADAIARAKSTEPKAIRQALAQTKEFTGVTGNITFDENGDPIDKSVVIMKFQNGDEVYVKTIVP